MKGGHSTSQGVVCKRRVEGNQSGSDVLMEGGHGTSHGVMC